MVSNISLYKLIIVSILILCFLLIGFVSFIDLKFGDVDIITLASVIMFIGVLIFSLMKKENFYLSLLVATVFFPYVITNIFPSFSTSHNNITTIELSIINHIDIFLLINIIRYNYYSINIHKKYFYIAIILLIISTLINIVDIKEIDSLKSLVYGTYNIRYLIYFSFIPLDDILRYKSQIIKSMLYGSYFLISESIIYTFINDLHRLTSGSLGVNSFGNLLGAVLVFSLFADKKLVNNKYKIITLIVLTPAIILSGTRTTILSCILTIFIIIIFRYDLKRAIQISIGTFAVFILVLISLQSNERYNLNQLTENIVVDSAGVQVTEYGVTSSLFTRFKLYKTSIMMISDKPIFGIGNGRWNDLKKEYGFDIDVLIDSHNSYLTILSQFGFLSIIYLFIIYIKPVIIYMSISMYNILYQINIITIFFVFAGFFNSEINKLQIASLLSMIAVINLQKNIVIHKIQVRNETT